MPAKNIALNEMAEAISNRVDINALFTIIPKKDGGLILSEIKTAKETGQQYFQTLAVYQSAMKLAHSFVDEMVLRAINIKAVIDSKSMAREYTRLSDLVFIALMKIKQQEINYA